LDSANTYNRKTKIIASNRKVRHDYEVIQTLETGIILHGTEVKSLRAGKCSIQDAYGSFPNKDNNELFLLNFHINPYDQGNRYNHEPKGQKITCECQGSRETSHLSPGKGFNFVAFDHLFVRPIRQN